MRRIKQLHLIKAFLFETKTESKLQFPEILHYDDQGFFLKDRKTENVFYLPMSSILLIEYEYIDDLPTALAKDRKAKDRKEADAKKAKATD